MPAPNSPRLHPDQVREHLAALRLTPANHRALATLLALNWAAEPPQVQVERVHAVLYAGKSLDTANRFLSRLKETINAAARDRCIPLKVQVGGPKQGGAAGRYLWFEEPVRGTVPARMPESADIPAARLISNQQGRPAGTDAPPPLASARPRIPPVHPLRDIEAIDRRAFIRDQFAARTHLHKGLDLLDRDTPAADPEPVVTLDYLLDWVDDPAAPPLFALLGEYGMGKTVTCQTLKRRLDERRDADGSRPLALYFDLRLVTGLGQCVPTLKRLCEECMERGWQGSAATGAYGIEDVIRWAADGAVVIFDGLDEVLVKLTGADGQAFTRTLLGLAALVRERNGDRGPRPQLLISCRTHYFRTLRDQQNHFTGQERAGPDAHAFRALVLLPLTEDQVRGYLAAALPDQDPDRILATVAAVHNLTELTQRPYTLKLVADQLPAIEARRLAGRPVYGTTLYGGMVLNWLERDSGKHHIHPDHKLRLAAHLAAHLWREGSGVLPAARLEPWFHAWLEGEPDLRPRYARLHPDQLEEDLRTATFLVREDGVEGSAFRFAHTSLLEYFLADYLLAAIRDDVPERWALPTPSPETLDFLGERLAEAAESGSLPALLATMQRWRAPYRPLASELLLAYALRALNRGWPLPNLRGLVLTGADLSDRELRTPHEGSALDLSDADLSGAVLRRVVFEGVRLTGARFCDAILTQASLLGCEAGGTDWSGARCDGAVWRETGLAGSIWTGAFGCRPHFIRCDGAPPAVPGLSAQVVPSAGMGTAASAVPHSGLAADSAQRPPLRLLNGHARAVTASTFGQDGTRLLSAGWDGTLRLWDAVTGAELLSCRGHKGEAYACAFAPRGAHLLSAGQDGTLRLWDAATGVQLMTCTGHQGSVRACAFAPDGVRLLSAGADGTLRLWDAASGATLLSCTGHEGSVDACTFAPDGTRLLSAGEDGTLRLWDAATGAALLTCTGHEGRVTACAFAPDGARLLSAGADGMLRLWDAATGAVLLSCMGHEGGGRACAFAPDGARLLSAGVDGTLRLWDAATGAALLTCTGHEGRVTACAFAPDGVRLLSAGVDGTLRLWDAASGATLLSCTGREGWVTACAFAPDGARLFSAGADGTLRLWNAATGAASLSCSGHQGWVFACAFAPDGARLLSAGWNGTLRLWDAATGAALLTCTGHQGRVTACAFAPDGARLLSAGRDDCTLRLWDAASGAALLTCTGHEGEVYACAFAPDGARLLSAGQDGALRLWDSATGAEILSCTGHEGWINACAFAPDGARLLSAGWDGTLRLWDAATGAALLTCIGHEGVVRACAFSPDGARLLSAGTDGTLRLWDAATGAQIRIHAMQSAPWPGHAVWEPPTNRLVEWSGDAWRWLHWVATDADGWPDPLPLETFGDRPRPGAMPPRTPADMG